MEQQKKPLIFQSDFGRADGAVSAMYGVAYSVCSELKISDLTHEIPQYDIWEASYRLIRDGKLLAGRNSVRIRGGSGSGLHEKEHCGSDERRPVCGDAG